MYTKPDLLAAARALCTAFASGANIPTILSHFTRDPYPTAHEHGLPGLAPFLGRTFTGVDGVSRYFQLLGEHLGFEAMRFEDEALWVVDTEAMAVVVRGEARFWSKKTEEGWEERFVYRLGLAEEIDAVGDDYGTGSGVKKGLKVQEYLVWADTGAAYLAGKKRLGEVQREDSETRRSLDRKRSGCGDVVGSGMNAYASCG